MLARLFSYELRALAKPAVVMAAIMVVAGIAGAGCLGASSAISDAAGLWNGSTAASVSLTWNVSATLFLGALFCGFLVWATVAALYVFVIMRFYRTMFTDEGYLTLTLPVLTRAIVAAKFLAAYLLLVVFAVAALLLYGLMVSVLSEDANTVGTVFSLMGGWGALAISEGVSGILLGFVNIMVTCAYALGLAFVSLTLGAWWARRHKVAAAVGIYLGIGWVLSFVFSVAGVLAMTGDAGLWKASLSAVSAMQLAANVVVAVGSLALTSYLVHAKVDLN